MEIITSRQNPLVKHIKKLGTDSAYRKQCGEFVCDGDKLLLEAVQNGRTLTAVFYCDTCPDVPDNSVCKQVSRDVIEYVSPMKTPQNIIFTCKIEQPSGKNFLPERYVILDGIQDPGNLGTIIRTANAMFIDKVILTGACADLYNPKTVRATMGAIFRQRVQVMSLAEIARLKEEGIRLYGAVLGRQCEDIRNVDYEKSAVCIGNEGNGLSKELIALCDKSILIPMNPDSESFNAGVAASVILWESVREKAQYVDS